MLFPTAIIKIKCDDFLMKTIFHAKLFTFVNNDFHSFPSFHSPFQKTFSIHSLISQFRKDFSDSVM